MGVAICTSHLGWGGLPSNALAGRARPSLQPAALSLHGPAPLAALPGPSSRGPSPSAGGGWRWASLRCSIKPWANPRPRPLGALPPALSRRLHDPPRAPHSQPPLGALAPESPHGRCQSLRSCPAGASECAHFLPPRTCPARLERRPAGPPADVFLSPRGQREPAVPPGPKANRRAPHSWHPRQPCPRHARTRARAHPPPRKGGPGPEKLHRCTHEPAHQQAYKKPVQPNLPATHLARNFLERAPVSAPDFLQKQPPTPAAVCPPPLHYGPELPVP